MIKHELLRLAAVAGLAAGSLAVASCSNGEGSPQGEPQPDRNEQVETSEITVADDMWKDALFEMRNKVDASEEMSLNVAWDTCVAWPNAHGEYTVVENPAMYAHKADGAMLNFFPFVGIDADSTPIIMNGPYVYSQLDSEGNPLQEKTIDIMGEVLMPLDGALFLEKTSSDMHMVVGNNVAWLETADGQKVVETSIVHGKDLDQFYIDNCAQGTPIPPSVTADLA